MNALQYQNLAMIVAILVLFAASVFGLAHTATGMDMDGAPHMPGCPFMGEAVMCTMTIMEHIQQWHTIFTATPAKVLALSFVMLLFVFALSVLAVRIRFIDIVRYQLSKNFLETLYFPRYFNHLQEAFSQGILNPKIY